MSPGFRSAELPDSGRPNDNFSGYRVECRWPSGEEEYNLSPSETELKVSDLNPSTTYRFRIQATNERGSSPFTGKFKTQPTSHPRFCLRKSLKIDFQSKISTVHRRYHSLNLKFQEFKLVILGIFPQKWQILVENYNFEIS